MMCEVDENELLDTIKLAAVEAGKLLQNGYQAKGRIHFEHKGASDFVTDYDRAAENAIVKRICRSFQDVSFVSEECGAIQSVNSDYTVIIDPLDGTNNFIHGVPHFSVSIAVTKLDKLLLGVVYHPLLDELIWAKHGGGAYLNDTPLKVTEARPLQEMLVSTCLPYHAKGDCDKALSQLVSLMPRVAGIRSPGSAALEIAYISLGRYDAFWSEGARLDFWDIAAAIVIARESGCLVSNLSGDPAPEQWSSLLVAHPQRHGELLSHLCRSQ